MFCILSYSGWIRRLTGNYVLLMSRNRKFVEQKHSSHLSYCRSSHQRCSIKKGILRNFTKFTGERLCQSLFFNKVAGLHPWKRQKTRFSDVFRKCSPATLLKTRFWYRCFPVNFVKFLRTSFFHRTLLVVVSVFNLTQTDV